jgi:hypothetical protein
LRKYQRLKVRRRKRFCIDEVEPANHRKSPRAIQEEAGERLAMISVDWQTINFDNSFEFFYNHATGFTKCRIICQLNISILVYQAI